MRRYRRKQHSCWDIVQMIAAADLACSSSFEVKGKRLLCDIAHHECLCDSLKVGMTGEDVLSDAICEESPSSCTIRGSASPCHEIGGPSSGCPSACSGEGALCESRLHCVNTANMPCKGWNSSTELHIGKGPLSYTESQLRSWRGEHSSCGWVISELAKQQIPQGCSGTAIGNSTITVSALCERGRP